LSSRRSLPGPARSLVTRACTISGASSRWCPARENSREPVGHLARLSRGVVALSWWYGHPAGPCPDVPAHSDMEQAQTPTSPPHAHPPRSARERSDADPAIFFFSRPDRPAPTNAPKGVLSWPFAPVLRSDHLKRSRSRCLRRPSVAHCPLDFSCPRPGGQGIRCPSPVSAWVVHRIITVGTDMETLCDPPAASRRRLSRTARSSGTAPAGARREAPRGRPGRVPAPTAGQPQALRAACSSVASPNQSRSASFRTGRSASWPGGPHRTPIRYGPPLPMGGTESVRATLASRPGSVPGRVPPLRFRPRTA